MVNAYVGESYKLVFPILSRGYLNIDFDAHTTGAVESTGVLVVGAVGSGSTKTLTVDTVDATTKFSVNDDVFDDTGALLGTIASLTATQIVLDENTQAALGDNENLKKHVIPTSESRKRSIWASSSKDGGHDGSFAIEAIITPYDVNGHGSIASGVHGVLDSTKTPPYPSDDYGNREANYHSVSILKETNYLTQKMMIFYNEKLKLYLQNTTLSSYNQPAEYKIVAEIKDSLGATHTFATDTVISASNTLHDYYDETAYYIKNTTNRKRVSASASGSSPQGTVTITSTSLPSNVGSVGQIVIGGSTPAHYVSPVAANCIFTIGTGNDIPRNTNPTYATGQVKVLQLINVGQGDSGQPRADDFLEVKKSDGTSYKFFQFIQNGSRTSGTSLAGTQDGQGTDYPVNSYMFLDINGVGLGAGNTTTAAASLVTALTAARSAGLDIAVPTSSGNTVTIVSAASTPTTHNNDAIALGGGNFVTANSGAYGVDGFGSGNGTGSMTSGVDVVEDNEFLTIVSTDGTSKKYRATSDPAHSTGDTLTDSGGNACVLYKLGANAGQTAVALKTAINGSSGHNGKITATSQSANRTVTMVQATVGAAGNKTNSRTSGITNTHVTIANFTGGITENLASSTPFITLVDNAGTAVTKKYVPVSNGDALANGTTQTIGDVTGAVAFQVGANATATASNLETAIEHANGHNGSISASNSSGTLTLTQGTAGSNGNKTITLTNTSNITKTDFANGATPDSYIQLKDHAGVIRKYKAATTEANNSSDGTYVFFRNGADTTESATNLKNAINHSNGHGSSVIATSSNNVVTYKLNNPSLAQATISLVSLSSGIALSSPTFSTSTKEISVSSGETDEIGKGNKIYSATNVEIGTVDTVSGTTITLVNDPAVDVTSTIYTSQSKEAFYLEQPMKISLIYQKHGNVSLYLNNNLVKKSTHTIGAFTLDQSDCRIGRGGDNTSSGDDEQFFGEVFEISMHRGNRPCATINTLSPGYSDILFYYTFGEV